MGNRGYCVLTKTIFASYSSNPAQNAVTGDFVSRLIWGRPGCIDLYCSIAVVRDDRLVAGILFHNWHPEEGVIELTSASTDRRWLTKPVLRAMFGVAFDDLGAQMAVLRVSDRNSVMINIARRFGFDMTHIPRLRGRDEGEWICRMTDDAWRAHPVARQVEKR